MDFAGQPVLLIKFQVQHETLSKEHGRKLKKKKKKEHGGEQLRKTTVNLWPPCASTHRKTWTKRERVDP